ncbi:conjugal transfer protein TraD [Sphingomonas panacis]|uniref:conjugal transfer protein TraD n=1 Tax=Sphingomonas panacis TaxID=1560345 RepID=UPI001F0A7F57|nr:conjugal transfer protein TraD [Sphingomonas panacis]
MTQQYKRRSEKLARRCLSAKPEATNAERLRQTLHQLWRLKAVRYRLIASPTRHDTHDWQAKRRDRGPRLIELVRLIARSGLIDLTERDRAVIFGTFAEVLSKLRGEDKESLLRL